MSTRKPDYTLEDFLPHVTLVFALSHYSKEGARRRREQRSGRESSAPRSGSNFFNRNLDMLLLCQQRLLHFRYVLRPHRYLSQWQEMLTWQTLESWRG